MNTLAKLLAFSAVSSTLVSAQTWSKCNPMEKTCDPNPGLNQDSLTTDFTKGKSDDWEVTAGTINYGDNGAEFTVAKHLDSPTIDTDFYIFYGEVEVVMRAASGQGIVSSIVFESDTLDEIDWECVANNEIQSNYFGKGNTTTYDRGGFHAVSAPQDTFHTYTVKWTTESIVWSIDGTPVRTLAATQANGGHNFPQTPMRIRLGAWAGGDSENPEGTIEWAGGLTDYTKGPFTMYVKSVKITNANPAEEYSYSDNSGSSDSIKLSGKGSTGTSKVTVSTASATAPAVTSAGNGTASATSTPTGADAAAGALGTTSSGTAGPTGTTLTSARSSATGSSTASSTLATATGAAPATAIFSSSAAAALLVGLGFSLFVL